MLRERHTLAAFGAALGAFATIGQVALMREAMCVAGGDELSLSLALTVWLVAIAAGAAVASKTSPSVRKVPIAASLGAIAALIGITCLRFNAPILGLALGEEPALPALFAIMALGLAPTALVVGFAFTAAARAARDDRTDAANALYLWEAVGAVLVGILFSLFLAGRVPHMPILVVAGAILTATGLALGALGRAAVLAAVVGLAAAVPASILDGWTLDLAHGASGRVGRIVARVDSRYGRLELDELDGQHQLFADGRVDYAFPDPWERRPPVHVALCQHRAPRRVLLLGGGAPDRLEAALAHRLDGVVLTFLDEASHTLQLPFHPASTSAALADRRVTLAQVDGRRYLATAKARFDVVLVSSKSPRSAKANRYHTVEFFEAAARALWPGGVVSMTAPGAANVPSREEARAAAVTARTMREVFAEVVIIPGTATSFHGALEHGIVTDDPEVLARRYDERGVVDPTFSSTRFAGMFDRARAQAVAQAVARVQAAPNTDREPLAYLANLQLWEARRADVPSSGATITGAAERTAWLWLAAPLALWLAAALLARRREGAAGLAALFSVGSTGAAGMALEVAILYAFQAGSGILYTGLAALTATFMGGLALGAIAGRRAARASSRRFDLASDGVVLLVLVATGPVLPEISSSIAAVACWSALAGAATGTAFPIFLRAVSSGRPDGRKIGAVQAAEHAGAAFGALITGIVWLPVIGLAWTCVLFAALKAAALVTGAAALARAR